MKVTLRKKKLQTGKISLFLDIYHQGNRKHEYLGLYLNGSQNDKLILRVANTILAKRQIDLANANNDLPTLYSNEKSFNEYLAKYLKDSNAEYKGAISRYLNELYPNLRFKDITESVYYELTKYLKETKNYQEWTLYTALWYVRSAINKAISEGIINKNPWKNIKTKKPESTRDYLEYDDLIKLKETSCGNPEIKKAFLFSCNTGLRFSDIRQLKWKNIEGNQIKMKMKKTKSTIIIPLSKSALEYISDSSNKSDESYVFDLPKSDGTVGYYIKIWSAKAGINKKVTFHVARHTFATILLTYGADFESVKELLGHSDIRTTLIYAKVVDQKKRSAIDKLPNI